MPASIELREYTGHREQVPDRTFRSFLIYTPGTTDNPNKPEHHLGAYFKYPDNQTHGFVWHGAVNFVRLGEFFDGLSAVVTGSKDPTESPGRTVEATLMVDDGRDLRTLNLGVEEDLAAYREDLSTPFAIDFARWDVKDIASPHKERLLFALTVDQPDYDPSDKRPPKVALALPETTPLTSEMIDYIRTNAVSEASPKIDPSEAVVIFQAAA